MSFSQEEAWEKTYRALADHIASCPACKESAQDGCAIGQELWMQDLEALEALEWSDLSWCDGGSILEAKDFQEPELDD